MLFAHPPSRLHIYASTSASVKPMYFILSHIIECSA